MGGILDQYRAILLDLNGTFMFGEDRFGPAQDYHATYAALGGCLLRPDELRRAIDECYRRLLTR